MYCPGSPKITKFIHLVFYEIIGWKSWKLLLQGGHRENDPEKILQRKIREFETFVKIRKFWNCDTIMALLLNFSNYVDLATLCFLLQQSLIL